MKKGLFLLCVLCGCVNREPAPVVIGSNTDASQETEVARVMEQQEPFSLAPQPLIREDVVETIEIEPLASEDEIISERELRKMEMERLRAEAEKNGLSGPEMTFEEHMEQERNAPQYVVMQSGDTLYSIARKYGTTVEALKRDNSILDHTNISIGQKIYIYKDASKAQSAPFVAQAPAIATTPKVEAIAFTKITTPSTIHNSSAFVFPVKGGQIIRKFGENQGGFKNDGINIAADSGDPIVAAAGGEVIYIGSELRDYGNLTIIKHSDTLVTSYSHADFFTVKKGDTVKQGEIIGYVGSTGAVTSSQLHFAVRKNNKAIDPMNYL